MSINTVALMGRLTANPELRTTPNGVSVTPFSIAVERKYYTASGGRQTDFIECVAWRQTAEFINKYFSKGNMIAVEGELQTRTYEDKDGNKRKVVEVVVGSVSFCGNKSNTASTERSKSIIDINEDDVDNGFVVVDNGETDYDDLPF